VLLVGVEEEVDGGGDLLGGSGVAIGVHGEGGLEGGFRFEDLSGKRGLGETGCHAVESDLAAGVTRGGGAGEADDSGLGGGDGFVGGVAVLGDGGRKEDDLPMGCATARTRLKAVMRFCSKVWRNSSGVVLWAGLRRMDPARLTAPSMRPRSSTIVATASLTA